MKFCKDCKNCNVYVNNLEDEIKHESTPAFLRVYIPLRAYEGHLCNKEFSEDVVTGYKNYSNCNDMRSEGGDCGKDATLYECGIEDREKAILKAKEDLEARAKEEACREIDEVSKSVDSTEPKRWWRFWG